MENLSAWRELDRREREKFPLTASLGGGGVSTMASVSPTPLEIRRPSNNADDSQVRLAEVGAVAGIGESLTACTDPLSRSLAPRTARAV